MIEVSVKSALIGFVFSVLAVGVGFTAQVFRDRVQENVCSSIGECESTGLEAIQ